MALPEAGKSVTRPRGRGRFRRRLRARIILSFFLLGAFLMTLFAVATNWTRSRVENALIEDVLNQNIDATARQYALDPNQLEAPVPQMRAFFYERDRFEAVRLNRPEWYALPEGIHNISATDETGEQSNYMLAVRKLPDVWFFLAYDMTQARRGEEQFRRAIHASVILFTLLSLLVGWWSASRVMRPVSDLAERLRAYRGSSDPQPLAPYFPENDEVGQLAEALDDYSHRLTEVVQRDREFNADVSHELRTPLAVIRGSVELMMSRPDLDQKTQARLLRIQRAEQQCTDLIGALLQLSRNERGHGATDIHKLAASLLEVQRRQLGGKSLELCLEGGERELIVDAPEAAVSVALGNLIVNAVKYTMQGQVIVRLLDNAVQVIDSGPGLSAEDAARLFERGYRGSHAEHSQGGGIGLSIVRRLCMLYGWSVRVAPGESEGVVATLSFAPDDIP